MIVRYMATRMHMTSGNGKKCFDAVQQPIQGIFPVIIYNLRLLGPSFDYRLAKYI